jgi:hypothetical protein
VVAATASKQQNCGLFRKSHFKYSLPKKKQKEMIRIFIINFTKLAPLIPLEELVSKDAITKFRNEKCSGLIQNTQIRALEAKDFLTPRTTHPGITTPSLGLIYLH